MSKIYKELLHIKLKKKKDKGPNTTAGKGEKLAVHQRGKPDGQ